MNKRIISIASSLLLAGTMLTGCGVSQSQLDSIIAEYDTKIAELEASVSSLESTLANSGTENVTTDEARERQWVIATDYVDNTGRNDVSDDIQKLIDDNPNSTIYFPDGKYRIDKPISTPATPKKSVDLHLSNYAMIYVGDSWDSDEAMIRLGAASPENDIYTVGSNYSFTGGIVNGKGIANGISIESGRETAIHDVSIKNTIVGIHVKYGANSGSSDADIYNVNIVGTGKDNSIGVLLQGYDNTVTNMRIAKVHTGVKLQSSGNMLRNIHPLYIMGTSTYSKSVGFLDENGNNWFDYCYSDQFCTGFYLKNDISDVFDSCFCFWYNGDNGREVAIKTGGKFNSLVTSIRVGFHSNSKTNLILDCGASGGNGAFQYILTNSSRVTGDDHKAYLEGKIIES